METSPWKIEWSDALSMSNPEIDAEHRSFITLVNELNSAIISRQNKAVIEQIMSRMLEESTAHFSHEERLFSEKKFPDALEHIQSHAVLTSEFKQALKKIHDTDFGCEWIEIGLTIKNLLVDHVLNEDTKYIEYLRTE